MWHLQVNVWGHWTQGGPGCSTAVCSLSSMDTNKMLVITMQQNAIMFQVHAFAVSLTHFFLDNGRRRLLSDMLYDCQTKGGCPVVHWLKITPLLRA